MIVFLLLLTQINPVLRYYQYKFDSTRGVSTGIFASANLEIDTTSWFFMDYWALLKLSKNIKIDMDIRFKRGNESTYPFYIWHDIGSMDYRKALLKYDHGKFSLGFGIDAPKLSQGYSTTLFFSGEEPGFTQIKFAYTTNRFSFNFLTGQMKELKTSPFWPQPSTKYLSFHKISYKFRENLTLSFSEAALFKSISDNTVDWYLLNPFVLWYPRQANYGKSDINAAWIFSLKWKPYTTSTIYGDFLIDDTPYKRAVDENPRVGGLLGYKMEKGDWLSILEASFVTRYTYSYYPDRLYLSWFFNNFPLGTLTGTDFIKLSMFLEHSNSLSGYVEILFQGEGKSGEPFELDHLSKKVLLSGNTKKILRVSVGYKKDLMGLNMILIPGVIYDGNLNASISLSLRKVVKFQKVYTSN